MESYASMIGLTMPFSAKRAVMREQGKGLRSSSTLCVGRSTSSSVLNNTPIFCFGNDASMDGCKRTSIKDLDDETASTTSVTDDDASYSFSVYSDCQSEMAATVTFATPLITDIHYRPRTLRQDKYKLFYSQSDYRSFRRAFDAGQNNVHFPPEVVTHVWEYDSLIDDEDDVGSSLYYTDAEIQDFLDEFVESLVVNRPGAS